jgi:hypothetical protein
LQAYERLTLLMERINPSQLVSRVNQYLMIKYYQNFIIAQIEQELEHNLTQQICVRAMLGYCLTAKAYNTNDSIGS